MTSRVNFTSWLQERGSVKWLYQPSLWCIVASGFTPHVQFYYLSLVEQRREYRLRNVLASGVYKQPLNGWEKMQGLHGTSREASSSGHSPANPQAPPELWLVHKRRSWRLSVRWWLCIKTEEEGTCPLLRPYCRSFQFCSGLALNPTGWEMWTIRLINWFMLNKYTKMWFKSQFMVLLIYDANSNCKIDQNVLMSQGHSLSCGGSLFIIYSIWRKEVARHWGTLWQPRPGTCIAQAGCKALDILFNPPHPSYTSEETQVWGDSVICS